MSSKIYRAGSSTHASEENTPTSLVYNYGENKTKEIILDSLPKSFSQAHREGYIHIHDLEYYESTYNCVNLDWIDDFISKASRHGYTKPKEIINFLRIYNLNLITDLANNQSGGITYPNFDDSLDLISKEYNFNWSDFKEELSGWIRNLFIFLNDNKTRQGKVSYYVTFHIGLSTTEGGRLVSKAVLEEFDSLGLAYFKPNIVYKVTNDILSNSSHINRDLLNQSLEISKRKMIPTYLLVADNYDAYETNITGCRSLIYANKNGKIGGVGRFNVTSTSINLPRLAMESNGNKDEFFDLLYKYMIVVRNQIIHRKESLIRNFGTLKEPDILSFRKYSFLYKNLDEFTSVRALFEDGSLSIGYIGLNEVVRYFNNEDMHLSKESSDLANEIMEFMYKFVEQQNLDLKENLALISPAGEMISGRFFQLDERRFAREILKTGANGFYTNSFHVKVNSNLSAKDKIKFEGRFHKLSTGGSISYVEMEGKPSNESLIGFINIAKDEGVRYLGFNTNLDVCLNCSSRTTSESCSSCGSRDIKRLRRVSGYIENLETFTRGKKNEERIRQKNKL